MTFTDTIQRPLSTLPLPQNTLHALADVAADLKSRPSSSTLLLTGSPESATAAAESLARTTGRSLLRVDLDAVTSKYVGETAKNLDRIFRDADASGSILFFDEADALFGKRTEVRDSHDRYANTEVSYLLQKLESFHGLVIFTTDGQGETLPPQLFRHTIQLPPDHK